ncbi:MAG: cyanophycinase [Elusimicrobia bacterium]|nr:MAG: cyanophycinase [Elusimicrobiota bacterium]
MRARKYLAGAVVYCLLLGAAVPRAHSVMAVRVPVRAIPRTLGHVRTVHPGITLGSLSLTPTSISLTAFQSPKLLPHVLVTPTPSPALQPHVLRTPTPSPARITPPSLQGLLRQKAAFSLKPKWAASKTGGQVHFAGRKMFSRILGISLTEAEGEQSVPVANLVQGKKSSLLPRAAHSKSKEPSPTPPTPRAGKAIPKGKLVIVGGGSVGAAILQKTLELAGGPTARVLVIPQASSVAEVGKEVLEMWLKAGAAAGEVLDLSNRASALEQIQKADFIWMTGGKQKRLIRALKGTGVPEAIWKRFAQGAVVGGTSAGAAVMSEVMITGSSEQGAIPGTEGVKTGKGLGLWPEVIVDQHFLRRNRFFRLLNAVLGLPKFLGIGIDESTAVVLQGREFEVVGESSVVVIDGRSRLGTEVKVTVVEPGGRFELE